MSGSAETTADAPDQALIDAVRTSLNNVSSSEIGDAVIERHLISAETYINSVASPSATPNQKREATIAYAAFKIYSSEAQVDSKEAATVSKSWNTDGLREDLTDERDKWLALISRATFEVH